VSQSTGIAGAEKSAEDTLGFTFGVFRSEWVVCRILYDLETGMLD
jgi:hypothetical protein